MSGLRGPVLCGEHDYMGFEPCPRCAATPLPTRIVLDGEKVSVVVKTNPKPWWIPTFVWDWLVSLVIERQSVSVQISGRKLSQ